MTVEKSTVWLIMSKDRKHVAKGIVRNREIISVDAIDNKRYLTYSSKGHAEAAFRGNYGFSGAEKLTGYNRMAPLSDYLEPVECELTLKTIEKS